ncbi:hypothetical protein HZZ02_03835 [Streptococcus danieliae]|nr:hypothetical protein [Streptococcus danieliae]
MKKRKKNYFVKAHEIVKTWARQVLAGDKQIEEVPDLHNLRAIVREIIAEEKAKEEAQKELGQAVNKEG